MGHESALPRKRSTLLLVATGLGLAGSILVTPPAYSADKQMQTRAMWLPECPSEPKEKPQDKTAEGVRSGIVGALLVALAPKIIEGAVDAAAGALKAAGETKTTTSGARISTDFYKVTDMGDLVVLPQCLVVVRGDFSAAAGSKGSLDQRSSWLSGLKKASFYLEARINRLNGLKYFELVPVKFVITEFDHWRVFGSSKRDYNVSLTLTVPGTTTAFGSATMNFPGVTKNLTLEGDDWRLKSAASLPIQYPPASADAAKVKEAQERKNAPFLLALGILNPADESHGEPPSVYNDQGVKAAADAYCDSLAAANKTREKERIKFDDRCDYNIELKRLALGDAIKLGERGESQKVWAHSVCKYQSQEKDADGVLKPATCSNMPIDDNRDRIKYTRFTTDIVLAEASEGSEFALFLGNALAASKNEVSKVLKDEIPKSEEVRDAENTAEAVAREQTAVANAIVAQAEIQLGEAFLKSGPDSVEAATARIALIRAQIAANDAARKASVAVPYPHLSAL